MKRFAKVLICAVVMMTTFIQPMLSVGDFALSLSLPKAHAQTVPGQNTDAFNLQNTQLENQKNATTFSEDYECGLGIAKNASLEGCFVQFAFWGLFVPLHFLSYISARFLDFFIFYSISNETYSSSEFITEGWEILRDLTNFIFIFALLYIAFQFVLNNEDRAKKLLVNVIIVGLTVNFSLFLTKVIIDGGNILGNVFYNQINVLNSEGQPLQVFNGSKQIAAAIVNKSNPQSIIGAETCRVMIIDGQGNPTGEYDRSACSVGTVLMQILAAAGFSLALVFLFASMGFIFLGRTIGLMFQMIFSPIAFASRMLPGIPMKQLQFDTWLNETLKTSFLAPVYIFFIYLSVMFLKVSQDTGAADLNGSDPISTIIRTLIPFAITFILLNQGGKIAKEMAGTVATVVASSLNKVGGSIAGVATTAAIGAATGGAGLLATGTLGRAGASLASSTAGKTGATSRMVNRLGNKMATTNFDFRASGLGKTLNSQLSKATGGNVKMGSADKTKGGWEAMQQRYTEKQEKRANDFAKIKPNEKVVTDKVQAEDNLRKAHAIQDPQYDAVKKREEALRKEREAAQAELKDAKSAKDTQAQQEAEKKLRDIRNEEKRLAEEKRKTNKYTAINTAQKDLSNANKAYDDEQKKRRKDYIDKVIDTNWHRATHLVSTSTDTRKATLNSLRGKPEIKDEFKKDPITTSAYATNTATTANVATATSAQNAAQGLGNLTNTIASLNNQIQILQSKMQAATSSGAFTQAAQIKKDIEELEKQKATAKNSRNSNQQYSTKTNTNVNTATQASANQPTPQQPKPGSSGNSTNSKKPAQGNP